jgi:hypothetical protein
MRKSKAMIERLNPNPMMMSGSIEIVPSQPKSEKFGIWKLLIAMMASHSKMMARISKKIIETWYMMNHMTMIEAAFEISIPCFFIV